MDLILTVRKIADLTELLRQNDKNVADGEIKFATLLKVQADRKQKLEELKGRMMGGHDDLWDEWMDKLHEFGRAGRELYKLHQLIDETKKQTKIKEEELKNLQMSVELELDSQVEDVLSKYGLALQS